MASVEEIQKKVIKQARRKAFRLLGASALAAAVQIVTEFASTVGATGMLGLAVHLPYGVLRTAAAAFAGLASVRWFLIPARPKTPAPAAPTQHGSELHQLAAMLEQFGQAERTPGQDIKAPANASGPYL